MFVFWIVGIGILNRIHSGSVTRIVVLELGVLLMSANVFEADFPELDVGPDEDDQDDDAEDFRYFVCDHQHPVEQAMG